MARRKPQTAPRPLPGQLDMFPPTLDDFLIVPDTGARVRFRDYVGPDPSHTPETMLALAATGKFDWCISPENGAKHGR